MNDASTASLALIGIGTTATATVRAAVRAYGRAMRALGIDTDAHSGDEPGIDFALLGGNRLAGRGSGGQSALVRAAFQDDPGFLDERLAGVRMALVVTALGGGTADGATAELLKRLNERGVTALVLATTPFAFEGEARNREAASALGTVASRADAVAVLPLDQLVTDASAETMKEALARAGTTLAHGITMLWRLLDRPGYIRLDAERLRTFIAGVGQARFTAVSATGPGRAATLLDAVRRSRLLAGNGASRPVRKILLGLLGGDDLRLAEIETLARGIRDTFAPEAEFALGTVNDEATFAGNLVVVVFLFEEATVRSAVASAAATAARRRALSNGERALAGKDRFAGAGKTLWHDEDLDIPTYLRRNLTLER